MSRLTNKNSLKQLQNIRKKCKDFVFSNEQLIYEKLGKLEDLEEQIGCSLEKFLATNEIYVLDVEGKLKKYQIIGLNFKEKQIWFWMDFCPMYLSFDKYKSMYWLKENRSE